MRLRQRLAVLLALVLCTGSTGTQGQTASRSDFRVMLLGSGIPVPQPDRFGPATLVEAGGQKLLFDAGRGATVRLFQLHVPLREVGPLFLTQFHSDHTTGIPDIWLSGVTAFEVDHGDLIKPAYGYRIDYDRRSVVISGDTRFNQNVIKYGTGADLLVHEVAAVRPELLKDPQVQRVMAHHTSPQDAGRVFQLARPRLAV